MSRRPLKVAHISDTHCSPFSGAISELGEIDVLVHSGDATFRGSHSELVPFFSELNYIATRIPHVIFTPGNHDRSFETKIKKVERWADDIGGLAPNVHILIERAISIEGYLFYGHPYTPAFFDWAFNYERRSSEAVGVYKRVPREVDVLITHGPPHKILDRTVITDENVGCEVFSSHVFTLPDIKLCCFGHIHEGYGSTRIDDIIFSNSAYMNEGYEEFNPNAPQTYTLTDERAEFGTEE